MAVCTGCLGNCYRMGQDCLCCHPEPGIVFCGNLSALGPSGRAPVLLHVVSEALISEEERLYILLTTSAAAKERGRYGRRGVQTEHGPSKVELRDTGKETIEEKERDVCSRRLTGQ